MAAKYGGRTSGWWLVANTPTRGSPSIFCSKKKEPWSHVALSHVLSCFPTLKLSSLHLVIFRHPYLTHIWSPILELFSAMNSARYFLHIHHSDFYLKKIFLPSDSEKILWSNKFSRYPLEEIIFFKNQDNLCLLWDFRLWILTTQPSHSYTLAYCRPIHLVSIEFQNIDNNLGTPSKKLFLPLQLLQSCNPCGHFEWDLFYKLSG
jgi:hypothetical protein